MIRTYVAPNPRVVWDILRGVSSTNALRKSQFWSRTLFEGACHFATYHAIIMIVGVYIYIYIYLFISHLNDDTVQIKMIMFPFTTIPGLHRIISEPSRHRRSRWTPALQRLQFPWQTMRIPIPLSRNDTRNDLVLWCNIMDFVLRFAQYWLKSQCQLCFTISPGIFSRKKLITKYRTRYSMYMCVYIYIYTYIHGLMFRVPTPPWYGSPGSTPFPSICKLLA